MRGRLTLALVAARRRLRLSPPGPVYIRIGMALAAIVAVVVTPGAGGAGWVLVVPTLGAAFVSPVRVGPGPVLIACALPWLFGPGRDTVVAAPRVLLFALAVYAVFETGALAAVAPLGARISRPAAQRWLRGLLPGAVATAAVGLVVDRLGRVGGSSALDVLGIAGALLALAAVMWTLVRAGRAP